MSQTAFLSPVETQLSPLQREIYTFLTKTPTPSVKRQELMAQLNCHHQGSFTRSLNQLAKQRLILLVSTTEDLIIELPTQHASKSSAESTIQLSLLPMDDAKGLAPATLLPKEVAILDSTSAASPEPEATNLLPILENINVEEMSHTKQEAVLPEVMKEIGSASIVKLIKEERVEEVVVPSPSTAELTHSSKVTSETVPLIVEVESSKPSDSESSPQVRSEEPENISSSNWVNRYHSFNKPTKKLMRLFIQACLKQKTWSLSNYPSHVPKEDLNTERLTHRLNTLIDHGFVQLSGAKLCRLTLQYSPLELCQKLSNLQDIYRQEQILLEEIHSLYQKNVKSSATIPQPKQPPLNKPKKDSTKEPSPKVQKPTIEVTLPKSSKPVQTETCVFEKRYYLLDSENCHQFLTSHQFLKQLKPSDHFIIFLSQNSPSTHPTVLHFILNHAQQIETRYVTVRGKGESDLDHVLTMELAYLWTQDPKAQYIILSKDQGFLASVNYWTQRHQLKPSQLCLKTALA